jgi:hypothetical protein
MVKGGRPAVSHSTIQHRMRRAIPLVRISTARAVWAVCPNLPTCSLSATKNDQPTYCSFLDFPGKVRFCTQPPTTGQTHDASKTDILEAFVTATQHQSVRQIPTINGHLFINEYLPTNRHQCSFIESVSSLLDGYPKPVLRTPPGASLPLVGLVRPGEPRRRASAADKDR